MQQWSETALLAVSVKIFWKWSCSDVSKKKQHPLTDRRGCCCMDRKNVAFRIWPRHRELAETGGFLCRLFEFNERAHASSLSEQLGFFAFVL